MPDYTPKPLPEDVLAGPVPLWGVWNATAGDWVRDPGDRTPLWFVTGTLAEMYIDQLGAHP